MDVVLAGVSDAFTLVNIAYVALGVFVGIMAAALPGLSAATAIAIAIPMTFYMSPLASIGLLVGINKGGTFGGAIPAVLINTPGTADAVTTTLDGHPLAKQGKPLKALKIALYSSVTGDFLSDLVLFLVAAPLAAVALMLGPVEIFSVIVFALTVIGALSSGSMLKGLIAAFLGIFLSTIGVDSEAGMPRLTFGIADLFDGINIISLGIGTLALAEALRQHEERHVASQPIALDSSAPRKDRVVTLQEFLACRRTVLRSAFIGTWVGATPGIGSVVAGFLGYASAKRAAKHPETFGKGNIEGIAATEAANSAVIGANLIPLLTLGIPGNLTAALIIGAFIIHGITPGPLLFQEQGRLIYGLFGSMVIATACNLLIGNIGLRVFAHALRIPRTVLFSVIVLICLTGSYLGAGGLFWVQVSIFFSVLGYLMRKLEFSFVTFIIGFILGPMFEITLRQTLILLEGDLTGIIRHPIALAFLALSAFSSWRFGRQDILARHTAA